MAHREVGMSEVREILRRWLAGNGLRAIAPAMGGDRKTGAEYIRVESNDGVTQAIARARELAAANRPVIVDLIMDYSKRTAFTKGAVKTNFKRFPLAQRLRMVTRAVRRKITG